MGLPSSSPGGYPKKSLSALVDGHDGPVAVHGNGGVGHQGEERPQLVSALQQPLGWVGSSHFLRCLGAIVCLDPTGRTADEAL